jgi:hypothetical protein
MNSNGEPIPCRPLGVHPQTIWQTRDSLVSDVQYGTRPAYRSCVPVWWKGYPSRIERLSNDAWGTALEIFSGAESASR